VNNEHAASSFVFMSVVRSCSVQVCVMLDGYYNCSNTPQSDTMKGYKEGIIICIASGIGHIHSNRQLGQDRGLTQ